MAAGLGFKDFTTGEVLTAADVDGYLMQGIWVFASAAARDAAVTSPQEGNFAYLKDTNVTTYYTGSAWANLDTTGMTNPMTTTGDTIYSSSGSTPARLGIGSTGQVLTVAAGVPSWATPAVSAGGMTFLKKETFSGVGSVNINSVFSSTYLAYKIYWVIKENTDAQELLMRLRASGTDTTSNYNLSILRTSGSDTLIVDDATATYIPIGFGQTTETVVGDMTLYAPNVAAPTFYTFNMYTRYPSGGVIGGAQTSSTAFDGFTFYSPNTGGGNNFTGDILIYGLNMS